MVDTGAGAASLAMVGLFWAGVANRRGEPMLFLLHFSTLPLPAASAPARLRPPEADRETGVEGPHVVPKLRRNVQPGHEEHTRWVVRVGGARH